MFITTPAHFSVELNAHSLLGICLLVAQRKLPESALSISNYHSQSCESTFRLTRSMSGSFSSIVNFTIEQFLKRAGKLSVLTEIQNLSEMGKLKCSLEFPKHHKRRRKEAIFERKNCYFVWKFSHDRSHSRSYSSSILMMHMIFFLKLI